MDKPGFYGIQRAMNHLQYRIFDGVDRAGTKRNYDLNIFGVRADNPKADSFDDWIGVFWKDWSHDNWEFHVWPATTDPGAYCLSHPDAHNRNRTGTAILVPGQYASSHKIGLHYGYMALVQNSPLRVYRDTNKDEVLDMEPSTIQEGHFGIDIHRANAHQASTVVQEWSAGCQVLADPLNFDKLMELCNKARDIWGPTFSYSLLTEQQLLDAAQAS